MQQVFFSYSPRGKGNGISSQSCFFFLSPLSFRYGNSSIIMLQLLCKNKKSKLIFFWTGCAFARYVLKKQRWKIALIKSHRKWRNTFFLYVVYNGWLTLVYSRSEHESYSRLARILALFHNFCALERGSQWDEFTEGLLSPTFAFALPPKFAKMFAVCLAAGPMRKGGKNVQLLSGRKKNFRLNFRQSHASCPSSSASRNKLNRFRNVSRAKMQFKESLSCN